MDREQFTFYASFFRAVSRIKNKAARCDAYDAICSYALSGQAPDLDKLPDAAAIAFELSKPNLDASRRKAENGKAGGKSKQTGSKPEANQNQEQIESKKENKKEDKKEKEIENECSLPLTPSQGGSAAKFVPPSVDEVRDYCNDRRNGIDPAAFVDFYASKGWKIGSQRMKDWRAAVRTWERRRKEDGNGTAATAERTDADTFHGWRAKSALDDC